MMDLSGMSPMVAIITGAASGIGLAIAEFLASISGTHVYLLDIDPTSGTKVAARLRKEFPSSNFYFRQCDVASWESQCKAFEEAFVEQGRIDLVVANAGVIEQESLTIFESPLQKPNMGVIDINISGVIFFRLGIYYLTKNTTNSRRGASIRGSIICTASCSGLYPFPTAPLYACSKHAVVGLVRSLALPLSQEQTNIRINAIAPGPIKTGFSQNDEYYDKLVTTSIETVQKAISMFLQDATLSGQVLELHRDVITHSRAPAFEHDETRQNIETYWNLGGV